MALDRSSLLRVEDMSTQTRQPSGSGRRRRQRVLPLLIVCALLAVGFVVGLTLAADPEPPAERSTTASTPTTTTRDPDTEPAPDTSEKTPGRADGGLQRLGYESGDFSGWTEVQEAEDDRIEVVQEPVRSGRYAARFEHRDGDFVGNGERAEVYLQGELGRLGRGAFTEGSERWFGWSTRFDASFPESDSWGVFTQWKQQRKGSPPLQMSVENDELRMLGGPRTDFWRSNAVPIERGAWHDFVVHIFFSSNGDRGYVEIWHNGDVLQERTNIPTLEPGQTSYLKQGIYRDAEGLPPAVVFHDALTIGDSYDEVDPRGDAGG